MMFRGHRPILGCIDHRSPPTQVLFARPVGAGANGVGRLKGSAMKFRNGKPERFAVAFRGGLSLHLHGDKVERPCPTPDTPGECRVLPNRPPRETLPW